MAERTRIPLSVTADVEPPPSAPVASEPASAASGPDPFCRWCGRPAGGCDQVSCARELDPPRSCPTCGRRLRVLVIPTGYTARCRDHGDVLGA